MGGCCGMWYGVWKVRTVCTSKIKINGTIKYSIKLNGARPKVLFHQQKGNSETVKPYTCTVHGPCRVQLVDFNNVMSSPSPYYLHYIHSLSCYLELICVHFDVVSIR